MKKRWLSLFLAAMMLFSLSVTALAAETRETDFFTDQYHSDTDFADMVFEPIDVEGILAAMDEVAALAADEANIDAVRQGFLDTCDLNSHAEAMYTLSMIQYDLNVFDPELQAAYAQAESDAYVVWDALLGLARDILNSPCASALDDIVSDIDREDLIDYENMTEEEFAMQEELTALEDEYWTLASEEYVAVVDGVEWTDAANEEAYAAGEIDYDTYTQIGRAVAEAKAEALGELYLRVIDANKRRAAMDDYEDAADYAYENVYSRDYTPLEIQEFHAAVKEYLVPVYAELDAIFYELVYQDANYETYFSEYAGDTALDIIEPYIAALSSEMYEAFTYMRSHGLYDSAPSATKADQGYTTNISEYNAPFFFDSPYGYLGDLSTAIHEFGHYNDAYWTDGSWYNGSKSIDICEVHSQSLELLFTQFYPEIFGEGVGDFVSVMIVDNILSAIIQGCLHDELQQYAYETENVTVQQINEKYCQLCKEYGVIEPDDERTAMFGWVDVHHNFNSPFYYISYAVSAAGAFEFWLEAQEDYFAGVDDYLRFTAQKMDEYGFQEGFEALGLESPVSEEFTASLAQELLAWMEGIVIEEGPTAADLFTDINGDEDWFEAVDAIVYYGIMDGVEEGVFAPEENMTRAQAATVLSRLLSLYYGELTPEGSGYFADVEDGHWYTDYVNVAYELGLVEGYEDGLYHPERTMSRQDFATIIYRIEKEVFAGGFEGLWMFDMGAADVEDIRDYANEAMHWAYMYELVFLDENMNIRPADDLTRAEMAQMLYGFMMAP